MKISDDVKDNVVVITGGGTGIGKATALLFGKCGARVVVCGRNRENVVNTVSLIKQNGGAALALSVDVTDWSQITEMIAAVLRQYGKIDILINNAGVAIAKPILDTTEAEWDEILNTNLKGPFLCCKAVLPSMIKVNKGVIVNVSSTLGKSGIANMGAYCASKFAVVGFTQASADELKSFGVRVYAICPGSTYTPLHRSIVGEDAARSAMPADRVAKRIYDVSVLNSSLPSGSAVIIDEYNQSSLMVRIIMNFKQTVRSAIKKLLTIFD
jgi:NAD(P)-dependent dehydrogenase (short-subunit alcohol dehydrogenase family)